MIYGKHLCKDKLLLWFSHCSCLNQMRYVKYSLSCSFSRYAFYEKLIDKTPDTKSTLVLVVDFLLFFLSPLPFLIIIHRF